MLFYNVPEYIMPIKQTNKLYNEVIIPKNIPSIKLTHVSKDMELNKTSTIEILKSEYRKEKMKYDLNKIFTEYTEYEERQVHKETNMRLLHILYVDSLAIVFMLWFFYFR